MLNNVGLTYCNHIVRLTYFIMHSWLRLNLLQDFTVPTVVRRLSEDYFGMPDPYGWMDIGIRPVVC